MTHQLSHAQLIDLVENIIECRGSEVEIDNWIKLFEESVPHPNASDLIFYPDKEVNAEEIVSQALAYKPKFLDILKD